ncbi:hypothetical protein FIBSPDRAFT_405005 [Athelia psychrophila]|uniref:BTB domain-containing protein n=1 Tax=Athelia psychrophila TaxID=1759441 RepID=A0A167UWY0_9AGAM|nr:hypothetical protein FIBSPDRAFT_405005 [Fibularhizoctonia sp. CBS 109695]
MNDPPTPIVGVRSDIWYDDGNVILQAEGTQFRVHKSILAQSSTVFNDMFSLPQPPAKDAEMLEGCPIVHLFDSAQEVRYILQAIFQQKYLTFEVKMPFPVLVAFLCLGRKYDIQSLHIDARKRLYRRFPATLEDDDAVRYSEWVGLKPTETGTRYIELVTLARRAELLSILPHVLYRCCQLYPEIITDNISAPALPPGDQMACMTGHRAACISQAHTTYGWLYNGAPAASCITQNKCSAARQRYLLEWFTPVPSPSGLDLWSQVCGSFYSDMALCKHCVASAQSQHEVGRANFWEQLPSLFGLPPWTELLREREDVE